MVVVDGVREGRVRDMFGLRFDLSVSVMGVSAGAAPGAGSEEGTFVGGSGCGG